MSFADLLSLYSIFGIWLLMLVNIVLSIGGFLYYMRAYSQGEGPRLGKYPFVTVMVPAHNEGLVIEKTVEALLRFDYPRDRYEIIVINDNSTDNTSEIMRGLQAKHPDRRILTINTDQYAGGKGKSNALNIGYSLASGEVFAIYDADNTPETKALRLLVENLMADDRLGAVIGKFRTRNRDASILTRFVNIETLAYQCISQAGRYFYFKLCTIPGTNFVIRRSIIERMGGWDPDALAEDTEISFQIYRMGYYIKMVPQAVTWEQEPHLLPIWFKQRTRWARGNFYVLMKNYKYVFDKTAGIMRFDILYYILIYVLMLSSLIISDSIFFLGIMGYVHVTLSGFSYILWIMAILVFFLNMLITLAHEENEFNLLTAFLIPLMLFTYSKLWVVIVLKAIWMTAADHILKRKAKWDKTVRYVESKV